MAAPALGFGDVAVVVLLEVAGENVATTDRVDAIRIASGLAVRIGPHVAAVKNFSIVPVVLVRVRVRVNQEEEEDDGKGSGSDSGGGN